jgi:hypothetical protein
MAVSVSGAACIAASPMAFRARIAARRELARSQLEKLATQVSGALDPSSGGGDAALGGGGMAEGGAVGAGGTGGMAGETSSGASCPEGYQPWLTSGFSFPDGEVIGIADFPSMPWAKSGSLAIESGRLTGAGIATVSQGVVFPYAGSRMRFRARFTDSDQQVTVAFGAETNGSGGVRLTLDSAGSLVLTEGTGEVARRNVAPLESSIDWYVEAVFDGGSAEISVSEGNYGSEGTASATATLSTDALDGGAKGNKLIAELSSGGEFPPPSMRFPSRVAVSKRQGYERLFVDTFERADSSSLGNAELPATSTWRKAESDTTAITSGALEIEQLSTVDIDQAAQLPLDGLRARVVFASKHLNSWLTFKFNKPNTSPSASDLGFWAWGDVKGVYTAVFDRQQDAGALAHWREVQRRSYLLR